MNKKIITLTLAGVIALGGTVLGGTASGIRESVLAESDNLTYELTTKSEEGLISCGVAPEGEEGLISCGVAPEGEEKLISCGVAPEMDLANEVDMYNDVLDYFITLDEALNSDMKYIAVNFEANIDDENKEKILENLKKYNVDIIEGNLDELLAKGLGDEYGNLYGILLSVSDIKIESEKKLSIEGSKYRSGLGSVSNQVILNNVNGTWEMEASTLEYIS